MKQITHSLTIGLNDRDTHTQLLTDQQAIARIQVTLRRHESITGYTIHTATGGYTHADGTRVTENSLILDITQHLPRKIIHALINDLKAHDVLNQESIMYTKRKTNYQFI